METNQFPYVMETLQTVPSAHGGEKTVNWYHCYFKTYQHRLL